MMGMRGSATATDSLELMLDTICNMFGGLILMAILVIMQTSASVSQLPAASSDDGERIILARQLENEEGRLRHRLADLQAALDRLHKDAERDASPNTARLLTTYRSFSEAIDAAGARMRAADAVADQARRDIQKRAMIQADAERRAKIIKAEIEQARERERRRPTEQVRLPQQKVALTIPRYYVVRGGTVYRFGSGALSRWTGPPFRVEDCLVAPGPMAMAMHANITPVNGAGLAIPPDGGDTTAFYATLAPYPPRTHHLLFFVYMDCESYASFQKVKHLVLARGYLYTLAPLDTRGDQPFAVGPTSHHRTE